MAGMLDTFKNYFTAPAQQGPVQPGATPLSQGGLLTQFQEKMKDPEFKKGVLAFGADMLQNKDPSFAAALGHGLNAYQANRDQSEANTMVKASKQSQLDKAAANLAKEEKAAQGQEAYIANTNAAIQSAPPEIKQALAAYATPEGGVGSKESADIANKMLQEYQQQQALDTRQKTALNTIPAGTQATINAANARQTNEQEYRTQHPSSTGQRQIIFNPDKGYNASARFLEPNEKLPEGFIPDAPGVRASATGAANINAREKELANRPTIAGKTEVQRKEADEAVAAPQKVMLIDNTIQRIDDAIGSPAFSPEVNAKIKQVLNSNIGNFETIQTVKELFPGSDAKDLAIKMKGITSDAFLAGKNALGSEQLNKGEDEEVKGIMLAYKKSQTPEQVVKEFKRFRDFNVARRGYYVDLMNRHGVIVPGINDTPQSPQAAPSGPKDPSEMSMEELQAELAGGK